jgi:serine/threonine-protein kinase
VFRVRDVEGKPFALKVLRRGKSATAETRFRREARALRDLGHPNIVKIVDADHTPDGRPYLVLEHLSCRALDRVLVERGPFDLESTIEITRQIASALAVAHRAGFVHRDLKPANILLVDDGTIRLTDFGVARRLAVDDMTRLTNEDQLLGTPSYMAPEQIRDARSAGPPADLYALGTVVIRLLTGRPPFTGSPQEILEAHLERPPPNVPEAGPLMPLILELLAKNPEDRPPSAQAVLDRLPKDETRIVPPVKVRMAPPPPRRLGRTLLVALIALMVAFVLGVLFANR